MAKLTAKQEMFVREYLVDLNGAAAARRSGYSAKNADDLAAQLIRKTHVAEAIQAAMNRRAEKLEITADKVLQEIACMAFYDPADIAGKVNSPEDIPKLPVAVRKAITGWSWDKMGNFVLRLAAKTPSLDQLGRHLKLFTDKVELEAGSNLADLLQKARRRARGE